MITMPYPPLRALVRRRAVHTLRPKPFQTQALPAVQMTNILAYMSDEPTNMLDLPNEILGMIAAYINTDNDES